MAVRYGDVGRALSPMSPSGAVEVNGERVDARSEGGFIEVGSAVVVLRGDPTGYVVRKLDPGQPPPRVPNHGEPIPRAEFQRNAAEVEEFERRERAEARRRRLRGLRDGTIVAAAFGAVVGLLSGGAGWYFGWAGVADPAGGAVLLAASLAAGAASGVALFFVTGLVGAAFGFASEGDAGFAPDFFVMFAALVGAAVGFWWQFGTGEAGTVALWSVGGAAGFAVIAYVLGWAIGSLLESASG
jgi:hypothetical protein